MRHNLFFTLNSRTNIGTIKVKFRDTYENKNPPSGEIMLICQLSWMHFGHMA